jgi:hypothetical protein
MNSVMSIGGDGRAEVGVGERSEKRRRKRGASDRTRDGDGAMLMIVPIVACECVLRAGGLRALSLSCLEAEVVDRALARVSGRRARAGNDRRRASLKSCSLSLTRSLLAIIPFSS